MVKANKSDKKVVVKLLHDCFIDILIPNSINYIIKKDKNRSQRLMILMKYQFNVAMKYGTVFISEEKNACILYIDKIQFSLINLIWNFDLVFNCIGVRNIFNTLKRERILKKQHPNEPFKHLWLMGVSPSSQGKGIGSSILQETLKTFKNSIVYLETTTDENIKFYKKNGFSVFHQTNELDYPLYFIRKNV
ncbi:hypothetical protein B4N84_26610 [Flavobacterium sp. IR1]|nr:hypothetical protein B4N84_26610 [Flavobacterium sp. IR1]